MNLPEIGEDSYILCVGTGAGWGHASYSDLAGSCIILLRISPALLRRLEAPLWRENPHSLWCIKLSDRWVMYGVAVVVGDGDLGSH